MLLFVEGPTDVTALKVLSHILHSVDPMLPDLSVDHRVAFVLSRGSTLMHWVNNRYVSGLGRPEVHIYDSDVKTYADKVAAVNARNDASWAVQTRKHEIESYLPADAINEALGVLVDVPDQLSPTGAAVLVLVSQAMYERNPLRSRLKDKTIKQMLAERAFPRMTAERLRERDPAGEVESWMRRLGEMLE